MKKNSNPVIISQGMSIGNMAAETDDEFLFECFFDHPVLAAIQDVNSSKMFLTGRTGSGKTALIRMLAKNVERTSDINLPEIALDYVANSDILRFVNSLDVDLDLFLQALWKHVLCIEYIRLKYVIDSEEKSESFYSKILQQFGFDSRRKRALDYLKRWEGKFWVTMDENVREMTEKLERDLNAEVGSEFAKFHARAGYANSLSREKKTHLQNRVKQVVNSALLSDLGKVTELLADLSDQKKQSRTYYIVIDRLDERWVDESVRYGLVRALIETLKSLRKIRDLKVVVAMRIDVLERVVQETKDAGSRERSMTTISFT